MAQDLINVSPVWPRNTSLHLTAVYPAIFSVMAALALITQIVRPVRLVFTPYSALLLPVWHNAVIWVLITTWMGHSANLATLAVIPALVLKHMCVHPALLLLWNTSTALSRTHSTAPPNALSLDSTT